MMSDGIFRRPPSRFRDRPEPEPGRYHLYVSWACPWAHRTIIGRMLKGLEDAISMSTVDPIRDERGWAFTGGEYADPINGFSYLAHAYDATDPRYDGRVSVPVLWDTREGRIVNNESSDILRFLTTVFGELGSDDVDLCPDDLREEIDALNERIYERVNNAVYVAGFSTDQAAYEETVDTLFATLDELDERLADRRFLFGDELWPYARELYQWPGVAETVRMDEIRDHYYRTHPQINPSGIVAVRPDRDVTQVPVA
jgi:glutathionyl-hydroquinone reductase